MTKCLVVFALLALIVPDAALGQIVQRPLASGWRVSIERTPPGAVTLTTGTLPPSTAPSRLVTKPASATAHAMVGVASYYWQGQKTASGEQFDKNGLTAAHRTLPMNTKVKVTHVDSGRSVVVRINDRGPFKPGRVVDVSDRAADILGFKARGLANVRLEVVN